MTARSHDSAIEAHALASGSSGNATLLKAGGQAILIDAGVAGRTLAEALRRRDVHPGALLGILLTHEHDDHLRGAALLSARYGVPIVANAATLQAASSRTLLARVLELPTGAEAGLGPFAVRSFAVSHDAAEPVGYLIEAGRRAVCYATDVGRPDSALREAMRRAALCVLESNHDLEWLRRGPYPPHMKARIASDHGHLSNAAAADVIVERLEEAGPASFWLAHLSRVNNSPALALRCATARIAARTSVPGFVQVALRDRPSLVWRPGSAVQLSLL